MRGNWNDKTKVEENSNFFQLIKLKSEDDPEILNWLERQSYKYTPPKMQNEMLHVLALCILWEISHNIQNAVFYSIMADECADISNKEQLVICIRWVDENLAAHEDFIGLHQLEHTGADNIVVAVKDVLLCMNLRIQDARGQCYDEAATMSGHKTGVATQIKASKMRNVCLPIAMAMHLILQWVILSKLYHDSMKRLKWLERSANWQRSHHREICI